MILPIGIDVSKAKLDICCNEKTMQINNTAKDVKQYFSNIPKDSHIVLEATGKYHRLVHRLLSDSGFLVMVFNPYQTKNFAKALNIICKTDAVDAKVLALFAEKMDFIPTPRLSDNEQELLDLSRHLDDLKKVRKDLESRQREADGFIKTSLNKPIKSIVKQIKETENRLENVVTCHAETQEKVALLTSIPGVGTLTAISLLSYLRELGKVSKREIAALSGLAPINNDSGTFQGKRRIRGGRHDVRSHLYMPIVGAATLHNARLKKLYRHHLQKGKPPKVALTACMRKLVVWANAMLATGEPWQATAC